MFYQHNVNFRYYNIYIMSCFRGGQPLIAELIKQKLRLNKEPVVVNILAVLLVSVLVIVSYTVRRESLKRRPNNKSLYPGTVSPLRIKSSSSSTGKLGSGKQSSQPPVWDALVQLVKISAIASMEVYTTNKFKMQLIISNNKSTIVVVSYNRSNYIKIIHSKFISSQWPTFSYFFYYHFFHPNVHCKSIMSDHDIA